jgi:phosphate transport system substrate-binding protein
MLTTGKTLAKTLMVGLLLSLTSFVPAEDKVKINISGSDTMNLLSQRLAEGYMKAHPNVEISVRGGGSGTGIADLLNGLVDIAQSSRKMKEKELATAKEAGFTPEEHVVALDGLAVAVNVKNPINELSLAQVKALYTGTVTRWNELDPTFPNAPVVLYSRESNCGTYDFFKEHVLQNANFAANTSYLAATGAIASSVGKDVNSIGFGGVAYFVRSENVKVLPIKKDRDTAGVSPIKPETREVNLVAVQDGSYPISRPLQFYTPDAATGDVKTFLDWVKGPEGQAIVLQEEYIPLTAPAVAATTTK